MVKYRSYGAATRSQLIPTSFLTWFNTNFLHTVLYVSTLAGCSTVSVSAVPASLANTHTHMYVIVGCMWQVGFIVCIVLPDAPARSLLLANTLAASFTWLIRQFLIAGTPLHLCWQAVLGQLQRRYTDTQHVEPGGGTSPYCAL